MNRPSTERFSDRVEHYIKYRPGYPENVLRLLHDEIGISSAWAIADLGSGTGKSAELFLNNGNTVHAVEPNAAMRSAAETLLRGFHRFHSVEGSAEATTLPARSIDCIVAAQAFHWFNRPECRREFQRILKPGGWVVLIWNSRRLSTPFLRAYEALLQQFGTDYRQVDHKNIEPAVLNQFFAPGWNSRVTGNEQTFDLESLKGRLLSSSYAPAEGHPNHAPMLLALERIFREHQENGRVRFEYDTEIHFGRIEG